jgi:tetratricopeptide (TPR) repeat protein
MVILRRPFSAAAAFDDWHRCIVAAAARLDDDKSSVMDVALAIEPLCSAKEEIMIDAINKEYLDKNPGIAANMSVTEMARVRQEAHANFRQNIGTFILALRKPRNAAGPSPSPSQASAEPFAGAVDAYLRGDFATTIRLMRPLADQGDANAQFILAGAYYAGKNYTDAIQWYRRAADQGHADAQSQLGEMYLAGQGVPQSYVQARLWFGLAAINPTSDGKSRNEAVHNRDLIARKMTAAQIAEAESLASNWKPKPERQ